MFNVPRSAFGVQRFPMFPPPSLECRLLPAYDAADLASVTRAFGRAPAAELRQAWLPQPQAELQPGRVRVGRSADALLVLAELTDHDIHNRSTKLNDETFLLGDAFEMFLRPERQPAYVEFHVTPDNVKLQLRFPDESAIFGPPEKRKHFSSYMIGHEVFTSRVWVEPAQKRWTVLASIPAAAVYTQPVPLAGEAWRFSFSRYDYTRGAQQPVLSSTSPHAQCGFHRQPEWGTLRFM
jgi:hypothetical protein